MAKFTTLTATALPLPVDNIDTDQIIPARFLKVTDKNGLGTNCFADWRYSSDGSPVADFALNRPEYTGAQILLAGDNFGCGSSREHAPWALMGAGFRVIVSTSFADIFNNNALKNGLVPVQVDQSTHAMLFDMIAETPHAAWTVDLESQRVTLPTGQTFDFRIEPFACACLLQGVDELGYILSFADHIAAYEAQ